MKNISLVLGSGGARGLAHIGVIRSLEEHGYKIRSISGCSMGACVGGFYAAGKLEEFATWMCSLEVLDMFQLLDFKGNGGLVSGKNLFEKLEEILGNHLIENLPIKYTALASDVEAEKEIWLNHGSLIKAIRASTALPMFFNPYKYEKRFLIDGGVLNPIPIAPTFGDNTDLTIAVNLGAKSDFTCKKKKEKNLKLEGFQKYLSSISLSEVFTSKMTMYSVADKSFDAMQSTIANMKLAAYPPDITIEIPRNLCGTFEFTRAKELIEYGYKKTNKTLKALHVRKDSYM